MKRFLLILLNERETESIRLHIYHNIDFAGKIMARAFLFFITLTNEVLFRQYSGWPV